ncbi:hypothetical protein D3C87_1833640 [compost metagenome]
MYWCHCLECQSDFIGDKRATQCADCAYDGGLEQRAALRVVEQAGDLAQSADVVLTGVYAPRTEAENTVDDLAMLVRKLVRHLPEGAELRVQAVDYLHRKGLLGSPLR